MTVRLNRRHVLAGAAAAGSLALIGKRALADLSIDITRGQVQPLPIAITNFFGADPNGAKIGSDISGVISANLERSGLFKPIDPRAFIQTAEALQAGPRFGDWRVINAQALVGGNVRQHVSQVHEVASAGLLQSSHECINSYRELGPGQGGTHAGVASLRAAPAAPRGRTAAERHRSGGAAPRRVEAAGQDLA